MEMAEDGNSSRVQGWSANRKTEVVLRRLRGEKLEEDYKDRDRGRPAAADG